MRKYVGLLCAAALTVPATLMITASPAAAANAVTCTKAAGTGTFTPPLPKIGSTTKEKSKLTSTGTVSGCTGSGVKSGKTKFTQTSTPEPGNCQTLVEVKSTDKPTKGTLVITWNNAKKSTAAGFTIKQTDATHANTTGKITAGYLKGKVISGKIVFKPESGGCTTKNLSKVTYTNTPKTKFIIK